MKQTNNSLCILNNHWCRVIIDGDRPIENRKSNTQKSCVHRHHKKYQAQIKHNTKSNVFIFKLRSRLKMQRNLISWISRGEMTWNITEKVFNIRVDKYQFYLSPTPILSFSHTHTIYEVLQHVDTNKERKKMKIKFENSSVRLL